MKNKCYEKILGWGTTVRERYIYIHLQAQHRRSSSKQSKYVSCSVMSDLLQPHGLQPSRFLCPWNSPGKNTGVGCDFLLQGIFLTQGSNLGLLHCRQILYHWATRGGLNRGACFKGTGGLRVNSPRRLMIGPNYLMVPWGFPDSSVGKESTCNAGDPSLIPELGGSPGERKGYPLQYSGLEKSMDCIVHGVQSDTTERLSLSLGWHYTRAPYIT